MMTKANTKYKTVKRKANVGERILITRAVVSEKVYANGDVNTVTYVYDGDVYVKEHTRPVLSFEYEVIIEESPSDSERITALESQVAELQAELQALKKSPFGTSFQPFIKKDRKPTPNEQRKAVIERAKSFVAKNQPLGGRKVEYVVNAEKRTVVALVYNISFGFSLGVFARGIAKCAPDDVFNADIGKAIALGRALGLDVSEFENAPKPTEVVVGSKVRYNSNYGKDEEYSVISINHDNFSISGGEFFWNYRLTDGTCDIIDDTEAQY